MCAAKIKSRRAPVWPLRPRWATYLNAFPQFIHAKLQYCNIFPFS
jgi:hypothetical protein